MKKLLIISFLIFSIFYANAQNSVITNSYNNKIKKRTINEAQIGSLIAIDEYGNYVLSTGSIYEKIVGFTTSAPYVTPNKPSSPNGSRVEFEGIISVDEGGVIKEGDFLCPCKNHHGHVKKCLESENPYAVAQENGNSENQKIKVKVLGYQRNR